MARLDGTPWARHFDPDQWAEARQMVLAIPEHLDVWVGARSPSGPFIGLCQGHRVFAPNPIEAARLVVAAVKEAA